MQPHVAGGPRGGTVLGGAYSTLAVQVHGFKPSPRPTTPVTLTFGIQTFKRTFHHTPTLGGHKRNPRRTESHRPLPKMTASSG